MQKDRGLFEIPEGAQDPMCVYRSSKPKSEPTSNECLNKRKIGQVLSPYLRCSKLQSSHYISPTSDPPNRDSICCVHGVSPLDIFPKSDYDVLVFGFETFEFFARPCYCFRGVRLTPTQRKVWMRFSRVLVRARWKSVWERMDFSVAAGRWSINNRRQRRPLYHVRGVSEKRIKGTDRQGVRRVTWGNSRRVRANTIGCEVKCRRRRGRGGGYHPDGRGLREGHRRTGGPWDRGHACNVVC